MNQSIVCLTFDFDAMSLWMARGMFTPTPISRGEFGVVGARRLLALLAKFDIRATWFIPGHTLESYPAICREIAAAGHEIGHHGWSHSPPATLSREQEESSLLRANDVIKSITGAYANGYRSPSWDLSPNSLELLLKHGFKYDSSMMGDDYTPYRVRQGDVIAPDLPAVFGKPSRLVEMPVSWSMDDYPPFEFTRTSSFLIPGLANANAVMENWVEDFLYLKENLEWGVATYTFHPQVIGRGHRIRMLERLISRLRDEKARFERMVDVVGEYEKRSPVA